MNIDHAKRLLELFETTEKVDELFLRRFSSFSFEKVSSILINKTFIQRNDLGIQLAQKFKQRPSVFQLLARSMLRWVIRDQKKDTHSSTASLKIFGGAPGSGKTHMATGPLIYDSDSDKLRILYLLKMTPTMLETEEELVAFLEPSGVKIEWLGDYLQPLQRMLRDNIFKGLAELCYNVVVIGLHANVEALQRTADAFREYKDCSFHLVDIFGQPEEQARRLKEREKGGANFAILPFPYARKAAVSMHEMVHKPELRELAASRNAVVRVTTIGSFREGGCQMETVVLPRIKRDRAYTM